MTHHEDHKSHRTGWLRASVLGANDGIVSISSLVIGVAAANATQDTILIAGVAGLVAGAMSMAAGEYVSVSSQSDTEKADLRLEEQALEENFEGELVELAQIYERRGLTPELAAEVAKQLMDHDALGAHARDEIGISEIMTARPVQAAIYSATMFTLGAALPLLVAWSVTGPLQIPAIAAASLVSLGSLGAVAARTGGAPMLLGAGRVTFWGAAAMALTALVGHLFGIAI